MSSVRESIFNKKLLKEQLESYSIADISNFENKWQLIKNWNYSLEKSNLSKTKEESLQGEFLTAIFTNVLDYHNRIGKNLWNIQQEQKTDIDSTKADGSLGFFTSTINDVRAVIELKDAHTDLDRKQKRANNQTPVEQAFSYQYKMKNCKWVIVSNFKEIRFYHSSTMTEYELFLINEIAENQDAFKRFYFLLSKLHLIERDGKSKIDLFYENNEKEQEKISNVFYQKYKKIRRELYTHIKENNPNISELVVFEKTQKIIDRFIFVCFCEDTSLLEEKIFRKVLEAAKSTFNLSETKVWDQLKGLFHSIDVGNPSLNINKFNGGLFKKDPVLDELIIKDDIFPLFEEITDYDFSSELDVNILGHIFEQSVSDIEEFKLEIQGEDFDPIQGKRKKDGIFYTSPGVTKYLLEETLVKWIEEREKHLGRDQLPELTEKDFEEYFKKLKNKRKKKKVAVEEHIDYLTNLQQDVRSVSVLDPACGSGAFLNMAFDILIKEGDKINQKLEDRRGGQTDLFDINKHILKNNLYGVDLNEESVEISKLSLWLKTANKYDELTSLDENIKSGNSIIEDRQVTPKALQWDVEFKNKMEQGGFDIIIGNPPYVFSRNKGFKEEEKSYYSTHYDLAEYQTNTYLLFIERAYHLLKDGGWFAFIVPNTCLTIDSFKKMRRFLLEKTGNLKIINIYDKMFAQASVDTCFIIFQKSIPTTVTLGEYIDEKIEIVAEVEPKDLLDEQSIINISLMKNRNIISVMDKIGANSDILDTVSTLKSGLKAYETGKGTPVQTDEMKEERIYHTKEKIDETYWKYLEGKDVGRYYVEWNNNWLKYGKNLAAPRKEELFTSPRILIRQIPTKGQYAINGAYLEKNFLNDINSMVVFEFKKDPLFILGILNSNITTFWFINKFDKFQRKTFPQFKVKELKLFPIPKVSSEEEEAISSSVKDMLELQREKAKFFKRYNTILLDSLNIDSLPSTFKTFYLWTVEEWLNKIDQYKKLSLKEKDDWIDFYESKKVFITDLIKREVDLNKEIDESVGRAFGLNQDDIDLINDSLDLFINPSK
ncbi:Eco57I restriction-modification methylase domain-containing protein (plasmid) [Bacillus salacetis]|uniref:Eco57I restriction-modification methylase domain-containing protein n=1 Tax=Bacillus salacetis TaxID=2315464 RepID=UPI003BA1CB20